MKKTLFTALVTMVTPVYFTAWIISHALRVPDAENMPTVAELFKEARAL